MIEAVIYDIDNTLTNDVSWLRITELLGGSVATHEDIFRRFSAHELPYEEAKSQLVQLWQNTGKADKAYWSELFADWPLKDGASELVNYTVENGYKTALITGSVDLFAEAVARKLHVPVWYANTTLVWDDQGKLTDFHYVRNQADQKLINLKEFAQSVDVPLGNCAAIGDGDNDVEIFRVTGRGIAVATSNVALQGVAWKQVITLPEVVDILRADKSGA